MSFYYVRSTTGNDINSGNTWAQAKQSISSALTSALPGDTIYVSQAHNYMTTSALTYPNSKGLPTDPVIVVCVNDSAQPPTQLATTAIENSMTAGNRIQFGNSNSVYWYGITFKTAGHMTFPGFGENNVFDKCVFQITGAYNFDFTPNVSYGVVSPFYYYDIQFLNCEFNSNTASTSFYFYNLFTWTSSNQGAINWPIHINLTFQGCTITGTMLTNLFNFGSSNIGVDILLDSCDLSLLGSGSFLLANMTNASPLSKICVKNSKLNSGLGLVNSSYIPYPHFFDIIFENCDYSGTHTRNEIYKFQGSTSTTTQIYKIGGASTGATGFSYVMSGNGYTSFIFPLDSQLIMTYCSTVGIQRTAIIEFAHDNPSPLGASDIWIELEYLSSVSFPTTTTISTRPNTYPFFINNAISPPLDLDAVWVTTGFSTLMRQKFQIQFINQIAGLVSIKVYLARQNYTVYIDPTITLS